MLGDNDLCMKSNNCISEKINEYRSEVETMIQGFQRQILEQEHKIEELKNSKERELDTLFKDLLSVVDAYEKAEARLDEQYSDNEAGNYSAPPMGMSNRLTVVLQQELH